MVDSVDVTQTLADAGEFGLITEILAAARAAALDESGVLIGPGDDAAVLDLGDSPVLTSMDNLVEGVHFKTSWSAAHDVGRKAVAVNVADIEAMGGRARYLLVGFSAPSDTPLEWVRGFVAGLVAECATAGVTLVGGDTTRGAVISVSVTVIGRLSSGTSPVTRAGARPGQVVAICGRLGWAAAGLAALRRGFRSPGSVVRAHRVPEVPYGQGQVAAAAGATAMIDVSDGLLADLGHLAAASGVRIDLDPATLAIADPVVLVGQATGTNALGLVLTGGEDHALVATFDPETVPDGWQVVGVVLTESSDTERPAVLVDGAPWQDAAGWEHFR
ncbi:MAG: thiamine-phosphate kinase [Propionibacteriaceae bacterium]